MSGDLAPMDRSIYEHGETVAVVESVGSQTIEAWVRAVRGWSEVQAVDWHFIGGRGRVAVLGTPEEVERVREAARALLPSLHAMLPALFPALYTHGREQPCAGYVVEAAPKREVPGG